MLTGGDVVAGYRIEGILGHGGMGIVYRATQLSLDRTVALKVVAPHLGEDEAFRDRFRREGRIQAALEHPNIITIHEAGESEHGLFIAMRLVDGPNLKEVLLAGELTPARALHFLAQIADALDAAHAVGLVHRDIKPQNILIDARDHAYLADFGLTKLPGQRSLTQSGQFLGTLDYTSPEQIKGKPATAASDLYSLGAVMYECLTGVVPYPRDTDAATLYAHLSEPLPPASAANPLLPQELDAALAAALAKEPEDRPVSAAAYVAAILAAAGDRLPDVAPRPILGAAVTETTADAIAPARRAPAIVDERHFTGSRAVAPAEPGLAERRAATPERAATIVDRAPGAPVPARESSDSPGGRRRVLLALAALILVAVPTGTGLAVGSSRGSPSPAGAERLQTGDFALTLPAGWSRSPAPASKYGMTFAEPLLVTDAPAGGTASLMLGWVDSRSPSLLPSRAAAYALTVDPAQPRRVDLAGGAGYAFRGRDRNLVAIMIPTGRRVAALVCENGVRAPHSLDACTSIARSLRLLQTKPVLLGVDADYARRLQRAVAGAYSARNAQVAAMRRAKTPGREADAARRVSDAYGAAASALTTAPAQPSLRSPNAALVAALRSAASAYASLASAAAAKNNARFAAAGKAVARAEATVRRRVSALRALGISTVAAAGSAASGSGAGDVAAGRRVFFRAGCAGCHTLKDAGATGTVGPDLDRSKPRRAAVARQVTQGGGPMPAFRGVLTQKQIDEVAAYVSTVAGR